MALLEELTWARVLATNSWLGREADCEQLQLGEWQLSDLVDPSAWPAQFRLEDFDDELKGSNKADGLDGGKGIDAIDGGAGADVLDGGKGDDELNGGKGDDSGTDYCFEITAGAQCNEVIVRSRGRVIAGSSCAM